MTSVFAPLPANSQYLKPFVQKCARRAVVIGCNESMYIDNPVHGSVNDGTVIANILEHSFDFEVFRLIDQPGDRYGNREAPTLKRFHQVMNTVVDATEPGDLLLFFYSGPGQRVLDPRTPSDQPGDVSYLLNDGRIRSQELWQYFSSLPPGSTCYCIMDSPFGIFAFSQDGTAESVAEVLPNLQIESALIQNANNAKMSHRLRPYHGELMSENPHPVAPTVSPMQDGVTFFLLSATSSCETALEFIDPSSLQPRGVFTYVLARYLLDIASLYDELQKSQSNGLCSSFSSIPQIANEKFIPSVSYAFSSIQESLEDIMSDLEGNRLIMSAEWRVSHAGENCHSANNSPFLLPLTPSNPDFISHFHQRRAFKLQQQQQQQIMTSGEISNHHGMNPSGRALPSPSINGWGHPKMIRVSPSLSMASTSARTDGIPPPPIHTADHAQQLQQQQQQPHQTFKTTTLSHPQPNDNYQCAVVGPKATSPSYSPPIVLNIHTFRNNNAQTNENQVTNSSNETFSNALMASVSSSSHLLHAFSKVARPPCPTDLILTPQLGQAYSTFAGDQLAQMISNNNSTVPYNNKNNFTPMQQQIPATMTHLIASPHLEALVAADAGGGVATDGIHVLGGTLMGMYQNQIVMQQQQQQMHNNNMIYFPNSAPPIQSAANQFANDPRTFTGGYNTENLMQRGGLGFPGGLGARLDQQQYHMHGYHCDGRDFDNFSMLPEDRMVIKEQETKAMQSVVNDRNSLNSWVKKSYLPPPMYPQQQATYHNLNLNPNSYGNGQIATGGSFYYLQE